MDPLTEGLLLGFGLMPDFQNPVIQQATLANEFTPAARVGLMSDGQSSAPDTPFQQNFSPLDPVIGNGFRLTPSAPPRNPRVEQLARDIISGAQAEARAGDIRADEATRLARNTGGELLLQAVGPSLFQAITGQGVQTRTNRVSDLLQQRLGSAAEARAQAARDRQRLLSQATARAGEIMISDDRIRQQRADKLAQFIATQNRLIDQQEAIATRDRANRLQRQYEFAVDNNNEDLAVSLGTEIFGQDAADGIRTAIRQGKERAKKEFELNVRQIEARINASQASARASNALSKKREAGDTDPNTASDVVNVLEKRKASLLKTLAITTGVEAKGRIQSQIEEIDRRINKELNLFQDAPEVDPADELAARADVVIGEGGPEAVLQVLPEAAEVNESQNIIESASDSAQVLEEQVSSVINALQNNTISPEEAEAQFRTIQERYGDISSFLQPVADAVFDLPVQTENEAVIEYSPDEVILASEVRRTSDAIISDMESGIITSDEARDQIRRTQGAVGMRVWNLSRELD